MVELIVSLSITAIIMVGLSMFFASSFQNVFEAQQSLEGTQGHFVINDIIRNKFSNLEKLSEYNTDNVIIQNKFAENTLPFTYIGLDTAKLVFKDFFMFKGMYEDKSSSDYDVKNPAGITKVGSIYYVVAPLENKIYECSGTGAGNCPTYIEGGFKNPIGITTNGTDTLFVTDAGNDQIIKIEDLGGAKTITTIKDNLNFPVGIDFYNDGTNNYLFFSEPYKNKVYRVKTDGTDLKIVVGNGDNEDCDNSALYCKLDFPTGVFADDATDSLYIADTGNKRVLKVIDPGNPKNTPPNENISFTFDGDIAVEKITFANFSGETSISSSMTSSLNGTYDVPTHTMTSGSVFTAYENLDPDCNWILNGNSLYIHNDAPSSSFSIGDKVAVKKNSGAADIFTITGFADPRLICSGGLPPAIKDRTYAIYLDGNLSDVSIGALIYKVGKNGNSENIVLDFSSATFPVKGFQNIDINVYEFGNITPVKTYEHFVRVGDGTLGTPEDTIAVLAGAYTYPTGSSMDSGLQVGDGVAFNTTGATFDYTTDFDITSLGFEKLNGDKILQATVTADGKEYIINGAIQ